MAFQRSFLLFLFSFAWVLLSISANLNLPSNNKVYVPFNRTIFPPDFMFGAASSAYQIEGAWNKDGKGPSVWDNFTHEFPEKIFDGSNGDIAIDFYHRYKEDIKMLKSQGFDTFRLSIAWTRILPQGKLSKGINMAGIDFYNRVIDELVAQGITPLVTLFHWDSPQALEDDYLGWLSPKIVGDFVDYVNICFEYFGDRVKYWVTLNEPYIYSTNGYDYGVFAPGRCSDWRNFNCVPGDSGTEPYLVSHNLLLAHATAVKLYREKYQAEQKGKIGFALFSQWYEPYSQKPEDVKAAKRGFDFMTGWFLDPVVYGDYPEDMKRLVSTRLPKFTSSEKQMLKGSCDFIGINYFTAYYGAERSTPPDPSHLAAVTDNHVNQTTSRDGIPIGDATTWPFTFLVPWGLRKLLVYIKDHYKNPTIYITEFGMPEIGRDTIELGTDDTQRVGFYETHISEMYNAYKEGVNVKGFYAWSLQDNFEWFAGFTQRFGINFIDYDNDLRRYPKRSALWLKEFLLGYSFSTKDTATTSNIASV